uniref:Uncharacterized protein n=1 Tax=Anguilla anguilla TaxID=7936 RepID=A0A0E9R0E3_ANGAN
MASLTDRSSAYELPQNVSPPSGTCILLSD